jgi:DHA2 family multidrug resistance protein
MALFFIVDPPYMERLKMKIDHWGLLFLMIGIGCLQVVLDQGQREDWFSSSFITWLGYISISSLIMFILVEFFAENPIVNLRTFKNLSFSSGNIIMFFIFFNLFSSVVLLPIYLQTLMGYTSFLAGLVLGPGGIASMITMLIAGKLVTKINPKAILAFGIAVASYSIYLMSQFNLQADFNTIFWPRVVMGAGMGFLFIPLTTLTLSSIRKEEMGNATAIFNLLRNLGGSFGVAIVTTILTRRAQFHQVHLVEHLAPLDRNFQRTLPQISQILQDRGFIPSSLNQGSLNLIYNQLLREASMLSFNDAFYILSIMLILTIPFVLLMKKGKTDAPGPGMH